MTMKMDFISKIAVRGVLAMSLLLTCFISATAQAASDCTTFEGVQVSPDYVASPTGTAVELAGGDPVGPFPLSTLMPFPWSTIQGIWTMKQPTTGATVHFSFEVGKACDERQVIRVQRFDGKYNVTDYGVGLGTPADTMVRAIMSSESGSYMIYIRQFKQQVTRTRSKTATVVTIRPYDNADIHLVAKKESDLTLEKYTEKQKMAEQTRRRAERRRMAAGRP